MKNKLLKTGAFIYFAFLIVFPASSRAQEKRPIKDNASLPKAFNKIFNKDGWELPKFDNTNLPTSNFKTIEKRKIEIKSYEFFKELDNPIDYYYLTEDGSLGIIRRDTEVNGILSYNVKGRTFAYSTFNIPYGVTQDGNKVFAGIILTIYYFDEDGDGIFETKYIHQLGFPKLPEWVKSLQEEIKEIKIPPPPPLFKSSKQ